MEEIDVLDAIHGALYSGAMDALALSMDFLFRFELIWLLIGLALFLSNRYRSMGTVLLFAIAFEICSVYLLKYGVDRTRPVDEYGIDALITSFDTSSFPSAHTAQWFCAATVFAMFYRESIPPMFAAGFLVAVTRLYLYAHYPTDVIAGAVVGIACAFLSALIVLRPSPRTVMVRSGQPPEEASE